ncbi:methionyl-tRNA synthetase [Marasmius tenuissimus]|nr:methionyl-tRNA synthetase [Marasmius tenuissimus]
MLGRLCRIQTRGGVNYRSFTTGTVTRTPATKPWYTTTPIFYPNAAPHIGHLYSLVTADIFARYQRIKDPEREVKFVTGTDEHGLKIQKAALAKGMDPKVFCDEISQHFRRLSEVAEISHTTFIRTSEERHLNAVQWVWRQLEEKGLIYKGSYSGWYSITDECFYTDSQVTPAPEDSTSTSTSTLAPHMISKETGSPVEFNSETNYMFRLSSFQKPLLEHYKKHPKSIYPEHYRTDLIQALENERLEDISISRPRSRLAWGVPVPGDEEHTVYVWVDAVISYLTGLGFPWSSASGGEGEGKSAARMGKEAGWPVDVQVIGKDIVRFHTIYLPAILLALNLPLQKRTLAHAHWTSSQKKMSKSLGNVTDPFQAVEEFGIDSVRYYLAKVGGRFVDDVDWSHDQLSKHDKELQSLLGNLFLRVTSPKIRGPAVSTIEESSLNGLLKEPTPEQGRWRELISASATMSTKVGNAMEELRMAEALEEIVDVLKLANKNLTEVAPWSKNARPLDVALSYVYCIHTLAIAGICLQPFVPGVAGKLLDALDISKDKRTLDHAGQGLWVPSKVESVRLFENRK